MNQSISLDQLLVFSTSQSIVSIVCKYSDLVPEDIKITYSLKPEPIGKKDK